MEQTVSQRLIALRKHLKLNQTEFGQKLSLNHASISTIENGKTPLTESNIRLICFTFGVNEAWLRDGTGEMFDEEALLSDWEKRLLGLFRELTPSAKEVIIDHVEKLVSLEKSISNKAVE